MLRGSSFCRRRSAGGQLEHPSEVKSSTSTGARCGFAAPADSATHVTARSKLRNMNSYALCFLTLTVLCLATLGAPVLRLATFGALWVTPLRADFECLPA